MRASQAVQAMTNGLVFGLLLWWFLDADGQGEARFWRGMADLAGALAEEFGQVRLAAEARYWEVVTP